eukprot:UN01009
MLHLTSLNIEENQEDTGFVDIDSLSYELVEEIYQNVNKKLDIEVQEDDMWNRRVCYNLMYRYINNVLANPSDTELGEIFITKSLLNHACLPNCGLWPKSG